MIEKIPDQIPVQTGEWRGTTFDIIPKETFGMACRKINELVDAVNSIVSVQEKLIDSRFVVETKHEAPEPADPYAEQRKWIGKLCRFWDEDDKDCFVFGILDDIDDSRQISRSRAIYFDSESAGWWEHCEPVKPDDDIIYKGGDNE